MTQPEQQPGAAASSLPAATATPKDEDKVMLVLAYLGIFALIPYLVTKDEYVKWHAKQGLTLMVGFLVLNIASMLLGYVPFIGWLIALLFSPVIALGGLVLIIVCILRALRGERWRIPVIADFADKW